MSSAKDYISVKLADFEPRKAVVFLREVYTFIRSLRTLTLFF
jgi:hypothetical protein